MRPSKLLLILLIALTLTGCASLKEMMESQKKTVETAPEAAASPTPIILEGQPAIQLDGSAPTKVKLDCFPDPSRGKYKFSCVPRDNAGNLGQLGETLPAEIKALPSLRQRKKIDVESEEAETLDR